MATRVEVSPLTSLAAVPNLNEIAKEDKLQTTYYHTGSKVSASPPVMVLAGTRNLGTPSRALPVPRLSPKPFSKENPLDTFANVKSPITSVKPCIGMSRPLVYSKLEDSSTAKALDENMPSLVEPKLDEGSLSSNGTLCNKALPQTIHSQNTIILFETTGPAKPKASHSPGKSAGEEQKVDGMVPLRRQPPSSKPETVAKPALPPRKPVGILQRQASLPSDERPAVLRTWEKAEEKEPPPSPGIKSEGGHPSLEARPRGKRRPASAIFESIQHLKPNSLETPKGKVPPTPPEKSWVRKPRPLSVDLTARFENKDILFKKVGSPLEESKEKGLGVGSFDRGHGEERSEPLDKATAVKPSLGLKEQGLDAPDLKNKVKEHNQKIVFKPMEVSSPETSVTLAEASVRKGWNPLEEKPKQEGDLDYKEIEGPVPLPRLEKSPELVEGKNRATEEGERVTQRDSPGGGGDWTSRGSVKKRVSLFGSESFSSWPSTESPAPAPEKEKGSVKVQDRIKEWMVESPEVPPERRRKSFQARPLSADLTKLFTRPSLDGESRLEKGPASSGELLQESVFQEKNKEGHILLRTDPNKASAARNQWKSVKPWEKTRQIERKLSSGNETDGSLFPEGGSTVAPHRPEAHSPLSMAEEDGDFQTVRATMFENNVVKCNVADWPLLTSSSESIRKCSETPVPGEEKASRLRKAPGDKMKVKSENSKGAEKPSAGKSRSGSLPDKEERPTNAALSEKHPGGERRNVSSGKETGNNLTYQRVEPRYDIVQMTSERISSEAVLMAPEEKAVTLRTNKQSSSVKDKQGFRSEGLHVKPQGTPDVKVGSFQASALVGEAPERLETATPMPEFHEPKDVLGGNSLPPNRIAEKPYLGSQDKAPGIVGNDKASHQSAKEKKNSARVPETVMVRITHLDPYDPPPENTSMEMSKVGSLSPGERRTRLHEYFNSSHPRTGLRATAKEETFDFSLRKHFGSRSMRKESYAMGEEHEWGQAHALEPEANARKPSSVDLRVTERWRRRTLPHDVKFDEFLMFPSEPSKRLGRRADSLSPGDTYFKKSRHAQEGPDSQEDNWTGPWDVKDGVPKSESRREPRETYFAVTYQISKDKREYLPDSSDSENRKPSSLGRDEPGAVHHPRKLSFLSEFSNHRSAPLHSRAPPGNFERKNWQVKEKDPENLSFSKNLRPGDQEGLEERCTRHVDGKGIDVDGLCVSQKSGNTSIPIDSKDDGSNRSPGPDHFTCSSRNLLTRRKQGDTHESPRAKAEDGYRSSVLDIDALMAEYREEFMKGGDPRDRREDRVSAGQGGVQWERPGARSSADHLSQRYDWRAQKEPQDPAGFRKTVNVPGQQRHRTEESSSAPHSGSETSQEKSESFARELTRQKASSTKLTSPLWAMPQSGLSDSPSDTWKKIAPAEDEKKDGASAKKPPTTKSQNYRTEASTPLFEDKNTETNSTPRSSPLVRDGVLYEEDPWAPRNSTGKREKAGSLHGRTKVRRGEYDLSFTNVPGDIKRSYSEKVAPAAVQEGQSLMLEARERRKEQLKAQQSLPEENLESTRIHRAFPHWERTPSNHKDTVGPRGAVPSPSGSLLLPESLRDAGSASGNELLLKSGKDPVRSSLLDDRRSGGLPGEGAGSCGALVETFRGKDLGGRRCCCRRHCWNFGLRSGPAPPLSRPLEHELRPAAYGLTGAAQLLDLF
ncbi:uncharacterized protein KIAA1671-like [Gracilinanus agilis]|uniref:uncharacterized protein KIAA1671-like n=1 Tax=Gracilinanus agilis TaxID=191870 RepID=UPI001CFF4551|nr:uncharacterized protein KIAA1671-like [Gracilinanus agilis]